MHVLVTGAAGFIGYHVSQALLARGDTVVGLDNLNDYYPVSLKKARLAELQLRVLLEEMHKRRMRVHVAGDVERVRANFVHGFRKLEVEITEF